MAQALSIKPNKCSLFKNRSWPNKRDNLKSMKTPWNYGWPNTAPQKQLVRIVLTYKHVVGPW